MGLRNLQDRLSHIFPMVMFAFRQLIYLIIYCASRAPRSFPFAPLERSRDGFFCASLHDTDLVGCVVLCLGPEKMSVRECCYYLTASITTVGYGDIAPTTTGGKLFMMPYTLIGLAVCLPIAMGAGGYLYKLMEHRLMLIVDDDPDDNESPQWVRGVLATTMIIFPILIGVGWFAWSINADCDWKHIDAFWWSFMTVMTVGYGDLTLCHPKTDMVFLTLYILIGVVFVSAAVTTLSTLYDDMAREKREVALLASFDIQQLRDLDTDGDGVDKNEYVLGMLAAMGHIDPAVVERYERQFDKYDVDGSGKLTQEDLDIIDAAYHQQAKRASETSRSLLTKVESTVQAAEEHLNTTVQVAIANAGHAVEVVEGDFRNRVDSSRRPSPAVPLAAPPPPPDVECGVVEALEMKEKKKKRRRRKEKSQRAAADAPSAEGGSSVLCGACVDGRAPASSG